MSSPITSLIDSYVGAKVSVLQAGYIERTAHAVAALATLRQAGLNAPGNDPRSWGLLFDGMPQELMARGEYASKSENAIQSALVLFAHHQASRSTPVHRQGVSLGAAVGTLALARSRDEGHDESTLRRFQMAAMGQTHTSRVRGLQQIISMMNSEASTLIGLDYGQLASDLYSLQWPDRAARVRLAWGRAIHRRPPTAITDSKEI